MKSTSRIQATSAWIVLGLVVFLWLALHRNRDSLLLWLALLLPIAALIPGQLFGWRQAFALPMLASIVYAVIGIMELIADTTVRWPSALLTAAAFLTFFLTIPATRQARRQDRL